MGLFLESIIAGVITLLIWAIILSAVFSWLVAFNIVNSRHPFVWQVERVVNAVTAPVLWPLRKVIPPLGGVDITPIIAILILTAAKDYLLPWLFAPIVLALGG